jgi:putative colanic acid biosynthesis acetyltransferase WcaF
VGEGAVVGARAVVVKDVDPWTVVAGNPVRVLKKRNVSTSTSYHESVSANVRTPHVHQ